MPRSPKKAADRRLYGPHPAWYPVGGTFRVGTGKGGVDHENCALRQRVSVRRARERAARALVLLREHLRERLPVRKETALVAVLPLRLELGLRDVPVRTAFLEDRPEIATQLLDRRPPEEPVAVVDLGDDEARL